MAEMTSERKHVYIPSMRARFDTTDDYAFFLRSIGRLWTDGIAINWRSLQKGESHRRVALPTYPFERTSHWITANQALPKDGAPRSSRVSSTDPLKTKLFVDRWFWVPTWERTVARTYRPDQDRVWIIFAWKDTLGEQIAMSLRASGECVRLVKVGDSLIRHDNTFTIDPAQSAHYDAVLDELATEGTLHVVHGWSLAPRSGDELEDFTPTMTLGFESVLLALQAIASHTRNRPVWLSLLTSGARSVTGSEARRPLDATLLSFARVVPQEMHSFRCQLIDLPDKQHDPHLLARVLGDVTAEPKSACIAHRGSYRWQEKMIAHDIEPNAGNNTLGQGDVIIITGGLGGIAMAIADYLARSICAKLILIARTPLPPRNEWQRVLAEMQSGPLVQKINALRALEASGATVCVEGGDVIDTIRMGQILSDVKRRFGRVDGVIHTAAVFSGALIALSTRKNASDILSAKVRGALVLEHVLRDEPLKLFVVCSSLTGSIGGPGQFAYVGANAFLDSFAEARAASGKPGSLALAWDDWKDVGAALKLQVPAGFEIWRRERLKHTGMDAAEGIEVFHRAITSGVPRLAVATHDLQARVHELATLIGSLDQFSRPAVLRPRPRLSSPFVAPSTDAETVLAQIWEAVLGVQPIGVDDPFLDLGGHSLLAIQVITRARDAFGIDLTLRQFFETRTIRQMALTIEGAILDELEAPPTQVKELIDDTIRTTVLPNGIEVAYQSLAETKHFYEDIFVNKNYAKNGIHVSERGVIFDVGANIGLFTLFAHLTWPSASIFSFEPAFPLFRLLSDNIRRHDVPGYSHHVGLGHKRGIKHLTYYPYSTGMSSFYADVEDEKAVLRAIIANQPSIEGPVHERTEQLLEYRFLAEQLECRMTTITDVMHEYELEQIDLLKIDVQKSENDVLRGIDSADWNKIRQIVVEVHDIDKRIERITSLLSRNGFDVHVEQDPLYAGTNIFSMYALSRSPTA
jgi:FkbM family methyltransferase